MKNTPIIIADHAGFCMGVKNAFDKSIAIAQSHPHTALLGDIVHNRFAVDRIKESGLVVYNALDELLADQDVDNVIIRAHGEAPAVEQKIIGAGKKIFDLTCPIVKKVQLLTAALSKKGHDIIIFGKKNHPEVIGISGYCSTRFVIISSVAEAVECHEPLKTPVLISQTTMNLSKFEQIEEILQKHYTSLSVHNTLCKNPLKTQESALELSKKADLMVIIGDRKSSNTVSLYERIKEITRAIFIEDSSELNPEEIRNAHLIGLTGGSSTPDYQIKKISKYIAGILSE